MSSFKRASAKASFASATCRARSATRARSAAEDRPLAAEMSLITDALAGYVGETAVVAAAVCCWSCCATGMVDLGRLGDLEADLDLVAILREDRLARLLSVGVLPMFLDVVAARSSELPNMGIGTTGSDTTADGCDAKSNIDRSSAGKKSCSMSAGSRIAATSTKSSS